MAALQHATFQQTQASATARLLSPQAQSPRHARPGGQGVRALLCPPTRSTRPAQQAQRVASVPRPALAVRHPEAVYRRRRLVVASLIAAAMTILLAVGRPEQLPGRELPVDGRIGWPAAGVDDGGVYAVRR